MADPADDQTQPAPEICRFADRLAASLADGSFARLALGQSRAGSAGLQRVLARRVALRGAPHVQFTLRHPTRDETRNLAPDAAVGQVAAWLHELFDHAHLLTTTHDIQVALTRKGAWQLRVGRLPQPRAPEDAAAAHNRERSHPLSLAAPFLAALGISDAQQRLVPTMARKWRQIVKYVEILDHAIDASPLREAQALRVLDFGAGKGTLTFAAHHHLRGRGIAARVTGVELRAELVDAGNGIARSLGAIGLDFVAGDIHDHPPEPVDIMIALHACDIATDVAMHRGVVCGASIIVCAPCCHKELRPQLQVPEVLEPVLRHGIHRTECAEMLTDSLRALLLRARGYDAQVFEFVSPEHTSKNRMVLAIRRMHPLDPAECDRLRAQALALKEFFGVRRQYLESLFAAEDTVAPQRQALTASGSIVAADDAERARCQPGSACGNSGAPIN